MLIGYKKMEQLFRKCCGLDLDKNKSKRILEIVEKKFNDMIEVAQENAEANRRDEITLSDFPITKGLKASMKKFEELKEAVEVEPVLSAIRAKTYMKFDEEVEENMPTLVGTLFVIVGHVMKEMGLEGRKPSIQDIERAERILDYTL